MKKTFFFKNHNLYFAQVSTSAWGYHVVTNFRCTLKRVVQYQGFTLRVAGGAKTI